MGTKTKPLEASDGYRYGAAPPQSRLSECTALGTAPLTASAASSSASRPPRLLLLSLLLLLLRRRRMGPPSSCDYDDPSRRRDGSLA